MIVVIDDVDDADNEVKKNVLHNQPTIGNLAHDLFVFRSDEMKYFPAVKQRSLMDKLASMRELVQKCSYP